MTVKDIIIQEINENSEYKHFIEYGEGRFMTSDAVEAIAESLVKKLNLPVVTHRAWIVEYTIDDSDVLQFNVTDAPNQLAAKAVAMYGLPRKAKLLNCSPVLHGG